MTINKCPKKAVNSSLLGRITDSGLCRKEELNSGDVR
jgi:hypothetical protein